MSAAAATYEQLAPVVSAELKASAEQLNAAIATLVRSCRSAALPGARAPTRAAGHNMMELEVRFGVTGNERKSAEDRGGDLRLAGAPFTQTDYERVARAVAQHGWTSDNKHGDTILRIIPETPKDAAGGKLRAEIHGTAAIEAYCRRNTLEAVLEHRAVAAARQQETLFFTRKREVLDRAGKAVAVPFADLEFRVSLAQETRLAADTADPDVRDIRNEWARLRKFFRHMNRVRFQAPSDQDGCVLLDLSIVHSNRLEQQSGGRGRKQAVLDTTTGAVGLFSGHASHVEYEVELEIDNARVTQWLRAAYAADPSAAAAAAAAEQRPLEQQQQQQSLTPAETEVAQRVLAQLHRAIRLVMGALQDSLYPVGRLERNAVVAEYMRALYAGRGDPPERKQYYFAGPNSVTLQLEHCLPPPPAGGAPAVSAGGAAAVSIVENYCVTDKADGVRALLFVAKSRAVYLITNALRVRFTGMECKDPACVHLLLDGEFITTGLKEGGAKEPLNLFAAFDLYAARGELLMGLPFADRRFGHAGSLDAAVGARGAADLVLPPYRLPQMQHYVARLAAGLSSKFPPAGDAACRLSVRAKAFYLGPSGPDDAEGATIFKWARHVLDGAQGYHTDGLILTPTNTAVNGDAPVFAALVRGAGAAGLPNEEEVRRAQAAFKLKGYKFTWGRSFKWKPPQQNTIDFLVTVATPKALTRYDAAGGVEPVFYKKLKLLCGYNAKTAGRVVRVPKLDGAGNVVRDRDGRAKYDETYPNAATIGTPFYNMLLDVAPTAPITEEDRNGLEMLSDSLAAGEDRGYKPRAFVPTTPYDLDARFCCLPLGPDGQMRAENGDPIESATIVEFRFEQPPSGRDSSWGWKPIRVYHDKTAQLRAGVSEFGNPFFAANDNWRSIHYPVTPEIIAGDATVDADALADAVYYNSARDTSLGALSETSRLRDFHNRVVKSRLLLRAALAAKTTATAAEIRSGGTLIDFAVGKAGDLHKWGKCGLRFVLGLDYSRDNIFNVKNGAIARAEQRFYERNPGGPKCLFLPADSSRNIRSQGAAFEGATDRGGHRVVRALFGDQPAPPQTLCPRFERIVAGGTDGAGGFQVGSCQFALHYFWKSLASLHGFLRNVAECVRLGGVFVGTCYDGAKLFDLLRAHAYAGPDAVADARTTGTHQTGFFRLERGGALMLSIAKKYTARAFEPGPQSVGLAISVFMDSIDRAQDEYLVHFPYLDELMGVYGFELLPEEEMVALGFAATGEGGRRSFRSMFAPHEKISEAGEGTPDRWSKAMSAEEQSISFLNNLFLYRKKHSLSAEALDAIHRQYVLAAPAPVPLDAPSSTTTKRARDDAWYSGAAEFTEEYIVL